MASEHKGLTFDLGYGRPFYIDVPKEYAHTTRTLLHMLFMVGWHEAWVRMWAEIGDLYWYDSKNKKVVEL